VSAKKLILIGGGVRAGKSAFALDLARGLGERRAFLATAEPGDEEMRQRIERHRREREGFETVEEPVELTAALERLRGRDVVVVDCLTLWITNLMERGEGEERILERADALLRFLEGRPFHAIFVTNEVGLGVVPAYPSARAFRDLCGGVHQRFSREAEEVYFAALGTVLRIKPGPWAASPEKSDV